MRIAILGAGAIGGFLGARLALHGADVRLVARGPHLNTMREHGLRLVEPDGEQVVRVNASDDLATLRDADAVFVTLKAHSLPAIAPQLAANLNDGAAVVSAQNGVPWWYFQRHGGDLDGLQLETVDPGGVIAAAIDPARVIGCIVYAATSISGPGVVTHIEGDRFTIGELDGIQTDRVTELSRLLTDAGLKAPISSRIRQELWLKLLGNAVFNPLSALTGASLGDMAQSPLVAGLVRSTMTEVDSVARRVGVEVPLSMEQRIRGAARVGDHKTSMLQDIEAGRRTEIDALVGSVVELAGKLDVPVPHLETLYSAVKLREFGASAR